MAENETIVAEKKRTKKEMRKLIYQKLAGALAEYKDRWTEKKFENKLKKASKLFEVTIEKNPRKSKKENTKKAKVQLS